MDFIYKLWNPRRLIVTGALDRESGIKLAEETGQLVGFGRTWLANVSVCDVILPAALANHLFDKA